MLFGNAEKGVPKLVSQYASLPLLVKGLHFSGAAELSSY